MKCPRFITFELGTSRPVPCMSGEVQITETHLELVRTEIAIDAVTALKIKSCQALMLARLEAAISYAIAPPSVATRMQYSEKPIWTTGIINLDALC